MAARVERPRQFKLYLSHEEWEWLVHISDGDDCSSADALRGYIRRRYQEMISPDPKDPEAIADTLIELARRLRGPRPRRRSPF